jgi:hypothetical protein
MKVLAALALASVALAGDADPRGWSEGTMAADTSKVLEPAKTFPVIAFPATVVERVTGPTVLFYFSPTCPHCRHVAKEVEALHERIAATAPVLGVASGSAEASEIDAFRAEYGITFPVLHDEDGEIGNAMQVRSTPSAMLVVPTGGRVGEPPRAAKGKLEVRDLWYPYLPGWDALVEGRVTGDLWKAFRPGEYLGNNVCGTCHREEHESWQLTHHSVAWRTLEVKAETGNAACVRCHVTGFGAPTGWQAGSDLVDVGCEACHGPGGPHDGERADARAACAGCHDAEHSIAFSVDKGVPLLDHYRTNALSDGEKADLQRALLKGEAPRALLAFPEGANVGSARCRECHAVEHAWWADDPHADAMTSLQKEGSRDPACVRCHATAKTASLPPPSTLDGFDTLGGVGCESCHGPGEKHAASQAAADIQGLGDSCPVCVIEAVCTSCHTPRWSPGFDLDAGLAAIRHGATRSP